MHGASSTISRRLTGPAASLIYKELGVRCPNSGLLYIELHDGDNACSISVRGDSKLVVARTGYNGTVSVRALDMLSGAFQTEQVNPDGSLMVVTVLAKGKTETLPMLSSEQAHQKISQLRAQIRDAFKIAATLARGPILN